MPNITKEINMGLYHWKWFVKAAMLEAKAKNIPFCPL